MTIKINTWIETYRHDFNKNSTSFFIVDLKPFDYNGKMISRIKVENGKKAMFEGFMPHFGQPSLSVRTVEIDLDENGVEVEKPAFGWGNINQLVVQGSAIRSIKNWELPTDFRFKIVEMDDARDGIFKFKIEEKKLVQSSFSPKINYIEMPFEVSQLGDYDLYLNNGEHRDKEVIISDIGWRDFSGGKNVTLKDGKLMIGKYGRIDGKSITPKIKVVGESEKYPHPDQKQTSSQSAAYWKVSRAIDRAIEAKKKLFRWGWGNDNKDDFQEAVSAIHDIIKIAKHGSEVEKEEFKTYKSWQVEGNIFNDLENEFKKFKESIHLTSVNNGKGWKYDLEKGEVDWGSVNQENQENKDKGNGDKKRKNENDDDSREPKRAKNEETEKIKQDLAKKDDHATNKLTNDLAELDNKNDQEKEKILADIEKLKNSGGAYEKQKDNVITKKNELAKSDPRKYGKMIAKIIQQKIEEFKVEISKLGEEINKKIIKLKNGDITSDTEVREIEEVVSKKVSEEVANVEVDSLLTQAKNLLNGTVNNLKSQLVKVKKDLESLKISTNPFQKQAYQLKKEQVNKALKDLENYSTQSKTTQPTKSNFFRPKVIIPISLILISAIVIAVLIIRNRKRNQVKKSH